MGFLPASGLMQVAYVVEDLDAAIDNWAKVSGVGPFFLRRHVQYAEMTYRDRPCRADVSLAFAFSGDTQIELIQQHNDAPSAYQDFVRRQGFGQQHLGVLTDDLAGDVARFGSRSVRVIQRQVNLAGIETVLLDTEFHPGAVLELIANGPALQASFNAMKAAAREWDGVDPRRE